MRVRALGAAVLGVASFGLVATSSSSWARVSPGADPAGPDPIVRLAVVLQPRDPAALTRFADAVSDPASPQYGQYLRPGQLGPAFGATSSTIREVDTVLSAQGLDPGPVTADDLEVPVTGRLRAVARAFATTFRVSGATFVPVAAPSVPQAIGADVQAVLGLDDRALGQPEAGTPQSAAAPHACPAAAALPAAKRRVHPKDAFLTDDRIAAAYGADPLYRAGDTGRGVTVDIFEQEQNYPADIGAYEKCFGLHVPVHYLSVVGGAAAPIAALDDGLETELDVDNVASFAPGSKINVYQAPDSPLGAVDEYRAMVDHDDAQVISTSWGECSEANVLLSLGVSALEAEDTIFQLAAAQGQTVLAASADQGAQDCDLPDIGSTIKRTDFPITSTDDPASQPYVTGVGGTRLTLDAANRRVAEVVWNDGGPLTKGGEAAAGGGGPSREWAMPSWQYTTLDDQGWLPPSVDGELNCPVTINARTNDFCREVPDVTGNADVLSAYVVYWHGAYVGVGGTSGSTPLWAGLVALGDSCARAAGRRPLGFLDPALYRVANNPNAYRQAFYDITQGNNDVYPPLLPLEGFAAARGYDMASGLGAPNAGGRSGVIDQLCAGAAR